MKDWAVPFRFLFVAVIAFGTAGLLAWLELTTDPTRTVGTTLAVFLPVLGLPMAFILYTTFWPNDLLRQKQRKAEHSVEKRWLLEASSASFFWLAAVLIWVDLVGQMLEIAWLSPMRMYHVLAVAVLVYAANYLLARRKDA